MKIVTRFPPSPTGYFHIGSARTALFNYLFAAHNKGTMFLRFEDTDEERSKTEFELDILEGLKWLSITFDTPEVFRQSERTHIYKKYIKMLLDKGAAYEAEGAADDPSRPVIRFKNPNTSMKFADLIRGDISFDTTDLTDFVIAKSVDDPLYHLAVVIDDYEMGVSHVIRGEDHISNTPRQILILEALGFERPSYAHIPLILAPDRSKLSKRHGAVSVNEYRRDGYLPEALVNYLALLGWNPGGNEELFTMEKLIDTFSLEEVQKGGAIFDLEKLRWFNKEYIGHLSPDALKENVVSTLKGSVEKRGLIFSQDIAEKLVPVVDERIHVWSDISKMVEAGELDFFFYDPRPSASELCNKDESPELAHKYLHEVRALLEAVAPQDYADAEKIKSAVWDYATKEGRGNVLWPLRYALSGKARSPDPFTIASLIGKESTVRRVGAAIKILKMS